MRLIKKIEVDHSKKRIRFVIDLFSPKDVMMQTQIAQIITDTLTSIWNLNRIVNDRR